MDYKPRRKLTREFKLEAVRQTALSEKPKAQVARELGVRVGQLRTWRLEFEEAVTGIARPDRSTAEDLEQLRRENVKLKMEIEILKGPAIYFARERSEVRLRREESTAVRRAALCEALEVSRSGTTRRGIAVPVTARNAGLTSQLVSGRSTRRAASRTAHPGCTSN